jgi:hypothetical protein
MKHPILNARLTSVAISTLVALSLTACGGGGSDDVAAVPAAVALSTSNQDAVARASALAVQGSFISGDVALADGGSSVLAAPRKSALSVPAALQGLAPALARVRDAAQQPVRAVVPASGKLLAAAVGTVQNACAVSGQWVATINDADNNQAISAGDSLSIAFTNCVDVAGETINGTLSAAYITVQTSPTLSVGASLRFENLSTVVAGGTASFNGTLALSYSEPTADTQVSTLTVAAPLTVSASRTTPSVYSDAITLQAGFRSTSTRTLSLAQISGTVNGAVSSVSAGGTVTLTTTVPIVQRDADLYPTSGQIVATGAVGSLRTTALNTTNVQIELDANGDGSYEASKVVLWTALL